MIRIEVTEVETYSMCKQTYDDNTKAISSLNIATLNFIDHEQTPSSRYEYNTIHLQST